MWYNLTNNIQLQYIITYDLFIYQFHFEKIIKEVESRSRRRRKKKKSNRRDTKRTSLQNLKNRDPKMFELVRISDEEK